MLLIKSNAIAFALLNLERVGGQVSNEVSSDLKTDDLVDEIRNAVKLAQDALLGFPFPPSVEGQMVRLLREADRVSDQGAVRHRLRELLDSVMDELGQQVFLFVRPDLARYYYSGAPEEFSEEVRSVFPDNVEDIRSASRCIAHEEWTASVFHLMRAVEHALIVWARQLGAVIAIPLTVGNWQDILNAAQSRLKTLHNLPRAQRSPTWDADVIFFSQTMAHFQSFKDGWRNLVMHRTITYDEREAREVFSAVRSFMQKLADRV